MTSSTKSASTGTSSSGNGKKRPTADMTRRMAAVLRAKGNQVCADCPNTRPMWVSFLTTNSRGGSKHLGVLVCADCAQHHYFELGEKRCHIQYLKMAHEFSSLDIAVLEDAGDNDAVNRVLEATLTGDEFDKRYVDKDEKEEEKRRAKFIKHKYKKHKWIDQEKFHKLIVHLLKRERRRMQERFDDNVEEEERGEKRSSRRDCNNKPERSSSSRRLVERDRKGDHSTSSRRSSRQKDFHDSYPAEKSSSPKRPYMGSNRTSRSQRSLSAEELYPEDSRRPSMGSRKGRSQRSVHNSSTDLSAENSKRPSMSPKKNRTIRRGSNESLTPEDLRADTGTEASSSARPSLGPRGKSRRRKDFNDSLSLEDLSPALSSNSPAPSSDASRKGNLHRSCLNSKMEKPQEENETKQQVPPQPRQGQPTPRKLLPTRQASGRKGAGGFNSSCPNLSFAAHQFLQQDNKPQATNVTNIAGTPQRKLPARARSARDNNDNRGAPARGSSNPNLVLSRVRQARNNNATPAVASSRKAPFQPPMPLQSTTGPQPPRMRSNPNLMMGPPSAPQTTSRLQPTRMASNPNMMMMRPPSAAMQPPQMRPQPTRMGSNPNMMMMRPPSAATQPPQMRHQPTRMGSNPNMMMMMRPPLAAMQPPQTTMRPQPKRMGSNRNMMTTMQPPKNKLQSLADDFVRSSIVTALQQQGGASGVVSRNIIPVAPAADPVSNLLAAAGVAHPGALGRMAPARTVSAKGFGGHVAAASPLPPKQQQQQQQQQTPKLTSTMIRAKLLSASSRNLATRRSFDQTESTVDSEIDEVAAAAGVNLRKVQSLGELSVSSTSTQENMNKLATSQRQISSAGLARLRATLR